MNLNDYQIKTETTAIYPKEKGLEYLALGLAGEAGEVAGKVSKVIRDDNTQLLYETRKALCYELGDVLWFVARLADHLNLTLEEVAVMNLAKLSTRAQAGTIKGSGDNR